MNFVYTHENRILFYLYIGLPQVTVRMSVAYIDSKTTVTVLIKVVETLEHNLNHVKKYTEYYIQFNTSGMYMSVDLILRAIFARDLK